MGILDFTQATAHHQFLREGRLCIAPFNAPADRIGTCISAWAGHSGILWDTVGHQPTFSDLTARHEVVQRMTQKYGRAIYTRGNADEAQHAALMAAALSPTAPPTLLVWQVGPPVNGITQLTGEPKMAIQGGANLMIMLLGESCTAILVPPRGGHAAWSGNETSWQPPNCSPPPYDSVWTGALHVGDKVEPPAQALMTHTAAIWGAPSTSLDMAKQLTIAVVNSIMEESRPIQNHAQWPWPVAVWAKLGTLPKQGLTAATAINWLKNWVPALMQHLLSGPEALREIAEGEPRLLLQIFVERLRTVQAVALLTSAGGKMEIQVARYACEGAARYLVLFHSLKGIRPMLLLPQQMTTPKQAQARQCLVQWINLGGVAAPPELSIGVREQPA